MSAVLSVLLELDRARKQGVVLRRADVECRSLICAVLLVHVLPGGAFGEFMDALRQDLGFSGVSLTEKNVPLMRHGSARFIRGFAEIVLARPLQAAAPLP